MAPDVDPPADIEPQGIGAHLKAALVGAHGALADTIDARKRNHLEGILHQAEADLAPIIGPVVQRIIDSPEASAELKAVLAEAATPAHQFGSLVVGFAIGAVVGPALGAALQPEIEGISNAAWAANPSRFVSADVAAAAVLKGVFDETFGAGIAARSGYNAAQFDHLVQTAGQSIGIEQALLLWRRGQITDAHLTEIVRYSNINQKFYGDVPLLRYIPLSVGEVVTANLKGHMSDADAAVRIGHAGIDPVNQPLLKAAAGRPPGIQEMLHLWNATVAGLPGFATSQADVEAAVRQSDVNDTYLPQILQLRQYLPPPRSIVPMLRSGAVNETQARQLLTAYGVQEPWATAFIREGQHAGSSAVKQLTQAQIVASYEARLMTRPVALARLEALTYSPADATALVDLADEKRTAALLNATVRMVGARYVAHKLNKADAAHLLATAAVPNAAQLDLFTLWDIERQANLHFPTPAGIVGAGRRGLLTPAEVKLRLNELGIADSDLPIFVGDGWPPTQAAAAQAAAHAVVAGLAAWPTSAGGTGPSGKNLTVTQIGKAYTAGAVGRAAAIIDLTALGYTNAQAAELVATFTPHTPPIP